MRINTRKKLGLIALVAMIATLTIIPALAVFYLYEAINVFRERRRQLDTAKSLAVHYFNKDPYKELFDRGDGDIAREERISDFKKNYADTLASDKPNTFVRFGMMLMGKRYVSPTEIRIKQELRHKKHVTLLLEEIAEMLKTAFGRRVFNTSHEAMDIKSKNPLNLYTLPVVKKTGIKRLRTSDPDEYRKKAVMRTQAETNRNILKKEDFAGIKDKWSGEEEKGTNVNQKGPKPH